MKSGKKSIEGNFSSAPYDLPDLNEINQIRAVRFCGTESLLTGFLRKNRRNDFENFYSPNLALVLILSGSGSYTDSHGREYMLQPGSLFARIPGQKHSNTVDTNSDYLECFMAMGPQLYKALDNMGQWNFPQPVRQAASDKLHAVAAQVWHLGHILDNPRDHDMAFCIAEMLKTVNSLLNCSSAIDDSRGNDEFIQLACRELRSNFQKKFSLQKFCRKHSIGYENFRKQFRNSIGCSPWHYRILCRMEAAEVLLQDNNLSIKDIAYQLGYNNPYEFSAQFKAYKKISPSRCRNDRSFGR